MSKIKLLKINRDSVCSDLELVEEFYQFLQGQIPEGMSIKRGHKPKMSAKKAMSVIWYLQEHFSVIPDNIEKCSNCSSLFDTDSSGFYWEAKEKFFCSDCIYLVPFKVR